MVKLRLLKQWTHDGDTYKPGQYKWIEVDPTTAEKLKGEGLAEDYTETTDPTPPASVKVGDADTETDDQRIAKIVGEVVKEAVQPIRDKLPGKTDVQVKEDEKFKKMGGFDGAGDFLKHVKLSRTQGMTPQMNAYVKFTAGHMEEGVDSQGGFLAPEDFRAQVLEIMHEEGQVASRCQQIPISGQLIKVPAIDESARTVGNRYGGTRGYTIAEGATFTLANPKFRMVKLEPSKKGTLTYVSDELDDDAFVSIAGLVARLAAKELAFIMDDEIINGTGAAQALGILNAPATVSQAKETGQAAATIVFENIVNMWSRCHARSRANAVWFINQDVEPQLYSMSLAVGTGGAPAYLPANGLSGSPFATLMGRDVIAIESCATLGTVGDILLCDMSQYLLGVKGGVRTAVSEHLRFDFEQNAYRASIRFDGQPWWDSALTPFKGSNTQSPFVSLATRA